MPSSISNSNDRLADHPAPIHWGRIVFITLCLIGIIEVGLRAAGREAPYLDTKELWAENRAAVNRAGENAIALLGTSRMQMDVHPETLESHFPGSQLCMLANVGKSTMGLLENLSTDPDFNGTVICGVSMHWIQPELWDDYDELNDYFENSWPREKWMSRLRSWLRYSVALSHGNSYAEMHARLEGKSSSDYLYLQRDRFKCGYFEKLDEDISEHQGRFLSAEYGYYGDNPVLSPQEFDATFARIQAAVKRLQARGCRVIFVRLPTSGGLWEFQQDIYHKTAYWEHFAAMTTAETYHFQDHAELADFECPDWSHLSFEDATAFTDALGGLLRADSETAFP